MRRIKTSIPPAYLLKQMDYINLEREEEEEEKDITQRKSCNVNLEEIKKKIKLERWKKN